MTSRDVMTVRMPLIVISMMVVASMCVSAAPFYADRSDLMFWIDDAGEAQPVRTVEDWAKRRAHILENMQLVMGEHPGAERSVPLDVQVDEETAEDGFTLRRISYAAEPGDRVPALLLIPDDLEAPVPGILCLHQTTRIGKAEPAGLGGLANLHYARELSLRGYVTLAPDYPGYGDNDTDPYALGYVSATMKGIWNHQRAVDLLQSLPEVDPDRIGCIGHSLGGHNALFISVFDERIKAVVTSCGFNSFFKYMGGNIAGWSHSGYMPRIASEYGAAPAQMPFDFTELLGALAPRAVFINAPTGDSNFEVSGVHDCLNAARPVYELQSASERLVARHPDCGHDFPPDVREEAYAFLDDALERTGGATPVTENVREPHLLGVPIEDANRISYRVCPGYGINGHDLLCWTTTAESGGHFCALDLETDRLDIKPLNHLEAYPITPASDGAIYVGSTTGEIWRYSVEASVWEVLARPWDNSGGRGVHHIRVLCEGADGWLYCGSCYGERARVSKQTGEVQLLPELPEQGNWYVSAVVPLPDGRIAFGCGYVARIFVYDPEQGTDVAQWAPESWRDDGFVISMDAGPNILYARHFPSGRRGAFDIDTGEFLGEAPWPPDVAYPRWSNWIHSTSYGSGIDFYVLPDTDAIATSDGEQVLIWHPRAGSKAVDPANFWPAPPLALEMRYSVTTDLKVLVHDRARLSVLEERVYEQPPVERGLHGLGVGPDGCIYGGAYQSTHLFRYDPETGKLTDLGDHNPGWSGETYSYCRRGEELVCASYTNGAIVLYDPAQPWRCDNIEQINPRFVGCLGQYTYRPLACTATGDGRVWGVGPAGWGSTGGGVSWVNPDTGETGSTRLPTAPFAIAESGPGELIVCDGAALRWWDAEENEEVASTPWPGGGAGAAVLMEAGQRTRLAFCDSQSLRIARLPEPGRLEVEVTTPLPIPASRLLWDGGRVIGGGSSGIAEFDPVTGQWTRLCATGPGCPYAFVETDEGIYFTRGARLYRLQR